ncbi:MAG: recombinase family protein, partial [Methyloceanibacter sp.]
MSGVPQRRGHIVGDEDRPPRSLNLRPEKGVSFKVLDDPSIDTRSRTGKLVMGILALIAEFENDTRRERQMDGIAKAKDRGVKFGRKRELTGDIRTLRVGLLCNGSHTLSFSKATPRGLRWDRGSSPTEVSYCKSIACLTDWWGQDRSLQPQTFLKSCLQFDLSVP